MNSRHKAREMAVQILYRIDIAEESDSAAADTSVDGLLTDGDHPSFAAWTGASKEYAEAVVNGVLEKKNEIDREIEESSDNWSVERMPVVDRNIIRIAVYEMRCGNVPFKVAIDEAVELAKRFGTEESGAFVNGILDKMHRRAEEKGQAEARH